MSWTRLYSVSVYRGWLDIVVNGTSSTRIHRLHVLYTDAHFSYCEMLSNELSIPIVQSRKYVEVE